MRRFWTIGTLAAFILAVGSALGAQQAATKTAQKPTVATAAKAEKEDVEKNEQEGAKAYKITVQLPAAVTAAFKKSYPNAVIRGTAKETENGKTVYEVESVENGRARDFIFSAEGQVLEAEEEIANADVPAPVTAALRKLYPAASVTVAEKVTRGAAVQYDVQLKGAAKKEASFLPDGKPVPPEAPAKK
jgi:hypothetical protein